MNTLTSPGFTNPVDDAQLVFRAVLQALSRPGIFVCLPVLPPALAAEGMPQGMLAIAMALCDNSTTLWLDKSVDTPQTRKHLRFHCGCPFTEEPQQADFAFILKPQSMPRLEAFNVGRADFPDRSTTLVLNIDRSAEAIGPSLAEITGPGVRGNENGTRQPFRMGGLPIWFWADWLENHNIYPLGVDIIFVHSGISDAGTPFASILGLPRTANVAPCSGSSMVPSQFLAKAKECTACM